MVSCKMKCRFVFFLAAVLSLVSVVSCKEVPEADAGPQERDVLLTASVGTQSRSVAVTDEAVTASWNEGEEVALVYQGAVLTTLKVTSVDGPLAQLTGKVKGAYPAGTPFTLYYGGTDYQYAGQEGTPESASLRGYMKADVSIDGQDNKNLILGAVTLEHQQAYFELRFRYGPDLIPVKKLTVSGSDRIVRSHPLGGDPVYYSGSGNDVFSVSPEGLTTVYFALCDESSATTPRSYRFEVTGMDGHVYTAHTKDMPLAIRNGNYFSGEWVLDKLTPAVTTPTALHDIVYDGEPHELLSGAGIVMQGPKPAAGAWMQYYVAYQDLDATSEADAPDADAAWVNTVPRGTEPGQYFIWYRVAGGEYFFDGAITPVADAPATIIKRTPSITAPSPVSDLRYTGSAQALITPGGILDGLHLTDQLMQYLVTADATVPAANAPDWSEDIPYRVAAGDYYVWYKVDATAHYNGLPVTPVVLDGSVPRPVTIAPAEAVIGNPVAIENLVYNGTLQQIVLPADASQGCKVYYYVSEDATDVPDADIPDWFLPTEPAANPAPMRKNAGTYYVWTKIVEEGSGNYSDEPGVSAAPVIARIAKADISVTAPTLVDGWEYDGEPHELLATLGAVTYGSGLNALEDNDYRAKLLYKVNDADWVETPSNPAVTGPGEFTVWFKVDGDRNFASYSATLVGTVVIRNNPELSENPTLNPDVLTYDGYDHQLLATGGATSHGTLSYKAVKADAEPAMPATTSDGWVSPYTSLTATDAGTYYVYVKITGDANHADKVFYVGSKAIEKAAATLTCSTDALGFTTSQGAGSTVTKTGVSCTGGTVKVVSANTANCTVSYDALTQTITVTRVSNEAFTDTRITVSVTPDGNHTWSDTDNVTFYVSGIRYSSLVGGDFHGFDHDGGNEQYEW